MMDCDVCPFHNICLVYSEHCSRNEDKCPLYRVVSQGISFEHYNDEEMKKEDECSD